ncbi:uncharacterized protein L3040_004553 [Drepanopeziza brunnea f. sp. 'multigermtubi']|uniref:uncharacterized protein n=1 Tax=Drepanopeziza brunnea f. sp. 'multigermtubi' TaxID=698441 RepID=UPI0023A298E0|nr:hypothetical protein L3040_004553 [Drepanopeziza brunnea f. sp. 'multigermtubi']
MPTATHQMDNEAEDPKEEDVPRKRCRVSSTSPSNAERSPSSLPRLSSPGQPHTPSPPAAQRLPGLKAHWLAKERERSGVRDMWKEEEEWAKSVEGATMDREEATRLWRFSGPEIREQEV